MKKEMKKEVLNIELLEKAEAPSWTDIAIGVGAGIGIGLVIT